MRTSGSLTTDRESTQHHFPEASCLFEGFCYGTNSIAQRFGNWSAALKAAGLPSQYKPPRENGYHRFHEEYARQEAQLMQERREKRQAKADLVAQRKSRDKARAAANAAKAAEKEI